LSCTTTVDPQGHLGIEQMSHAQSARTMPATPARAKETIPTALVIAPLLAGLEVAEGLEVPDAATPVAVSASDVVT
jgi:hypothetical protein